MLRFAPILLLLSAVATNAQAAPAPRLSVESYEDVPQPAALPYDERADANAALADAMRRASASGKRVLVDLGGNWCPDCRLLAATMALPELRGFVARHYEVVMVDIGRFNRNMNIPAHFGIRRPEGVPCLLVIDPATDRLINKGATYALASARSMTPQGLADYIARWAD